MVDVDESEAEQIVQPEHQPGGQHHHGGQHDHHHGEDDDDESNFQCLK